MSKCFLKIETDSKTELEFTYRPKAMKMPFNVHILDSFSQRQIGHFKLMHYEKDNFKKMTIGYNTLPFI